MATTRPAPRQLRAGGPVTRRRPPGGALRAGTAAPDFELHSTPDQSVRLSDFRARPVILAFYPADWSPVCGDELALFNELLPEFAKHGAQLMGISVDGVWCHAAYARDRKLHFPLLADFEPKGAVSKTFGVYNPREGHSDRALFVIDGDGIVRWSYVSPEGVNSGADGVAGAGRAGREGDHPCLSTNRCSRYRCRRGATT